MVGQLDVQERIEQPGDVAAQQQRGDARLVGLEGQRDDVAHQPHVLADVLGQAVVGARHRRRHPAAIARPRVGLLLRRAHVLRALLDLADAGQVFVELAPCPRS